MRSSWHVQIASFWHVTSTQTGIGVLWFHDDLGSAVIALKRVAIVQICWFYSWMNWESFFGDGTLFYNLMCGCSITIEAHWPSQEKFIWLFLFGSVFLEDCEGDVSFCAKIFCLDVPGQVSNLLRLIMWGELLSGLFYCSSGGRYPHSPLPRETPLGFSD